MSNEEKILNYYLEESSDVQYIRKHFKITLFICSTLNSSGVVKCIITAYLNNPWRQTTQFIRKLFKRIN